MRAKKQNLCRYLLTTMISQPITTPFLLKLSVFQPRYYYFITIIIFRLLCFLSSFLFRNFAWTIPCLECSFSYNLFIFQPRCHFLKKKKKTHTHINNFIIQPSRLGLILLIHTCLAYLFAAW